LHAIDIDYRSKDIGRICPFMSRARGGESCYAPPAMKRKRTERRQRERAAVKLVHAREKLARLEPGGAPDRPIEVPASPVIAVRARAHPCPQCGGSLRLDEETAETIAGRSLRAAHLSCQTCGAPRTLWFRIGSPLPS
jgi:hypothetical protein